MISRGEAEAIASRWARGEAVIRGYACKPALVEFDLGYVVWTRPAPDVLPIPGDGARTVIDRETGALSTWPGIPPDDIASLYRANRPQTVRTIDPAVALRRATIRHPTPTIAAELTVGDRVFRVQGAKGDQRIAHHPTLADRLAAIPEPARVRGAERHAELIAASEALHSTDGLPGRLAAFHVRAAGDPDGGTSAQPCETCRVVLGELGFLPRDPILEWRHGSDRVPAPRRFPPEVARVLAGGGWLGTPMPKNQALVAAEELMGRPAPEALAEFAGVRCGRRGPGRRRAIRLLTFDPLPGARQAAALGEFAQVVGEPVFPIAVEGGDAVVVLDERGRVFVLDQGGEWFVGTTLDEAITGLLTGDGPAARLHDDGTW